MIQLFWVKEKEVHEADGESEEKNHDGENTKESEAAAQLHGFILIKNFHEINIEHV